MVIDNLNLNLSQISLFTHIYGFADFNGFVDFEFQQIFRFNYGYRKTTLPARVISHYKSQDTTTGDSPNLALGLKRRTTLL